MILWKSRLINYSGKEHPVRQNQLAVLCFQAKGLLSEGSVSTGFSNGHELLNKGTITKDQYNEFQSTILEDVKKF